MQPERERDDGAEVRARAAHRPEKVGVLLTARPPHDTVSRHDLDLEEVVDRPAEPPGEIAQATAERQTCDTDLGHEAERRREAVLLRGAVDVTELAARLHGGDSSLRIDRDRAKPRHVDRHAPVGERRPGDVVAAAAHRDRRSAVSGEVDCRDDVCRVARLDDERGRMVDHRVPQERRLREAVFARAEDGAAHAAPQRLEGLGVHRGHRVTSIRSIAPRARRRTPRAAPSAARPRSRRSPRATSRSARSPPRP